MRLFKIGLPILMLLLFLVVPSMGCKSKASSTQTPPTQIATAQRGNLKIEVTASGNLALSRAADLAFEFGTAASPAVVEKVLVEVGDAVKQGQLLAELDASDWEQQKLTLQRAVLQAKINLKTAELNLENAKKPTTTTSVVTGTAVAPDPLDIEIKELQVELAKMNLENAQKELDKWLVTSPEVRAPFDGFVTAVNVKGGDEVKKGTIAVSVADPTKFEADILVNEIDIPRIQIGTPATVTVTSLPGLILTAKVTSISPTATIQGGVVNYQVKVEVLGPQAIRPPTSISSAPADREPATRTSARPSGPAALASQLRQGLTITVNLLIEEKKDVILVPSRAITRQGGATTVQVLGKDGVAQPRPVKVGSTNFQFAEIVEGLSEGEQVVIPRATTQTSTSAPSGQPFRMPIPIR